MLTIFMDTIKVSMKIVVFTCQIQRAQFDHNSVAKCVVHLLLYMFTL